VTISQWVTGLCAKREQGQEAEGEEKAIILSPAYMLRKPKLEPLKAYVLFCWREALAFTRNFNMLNIRYLRCDL
jgi:hypothetical protein